MMFEDIEWVCCGGPENPPETCMCNRIEMVVRRYIDGGDIRPMTNEEREFMIDEADRFGEGYYSQKELVVMNDQDLAASVLNAWNLYAQSMY